MEPTKTPIFKAHCSSLGKIVAGDIGLTEAQVTTLYELENKSKARTEKQDAEMKRLQQKRDNPELPAGAKTECKIWMKQQIYKRRKKFTSKYTERGDISELQSLEIIRELYGFNTLEKNVRQFVNEWFIGTPDALPEPFGIDAKNPWDCFTFPLLEEELPEPDYYAQAQGYMDLTGKDEFRFVYTLCDTPEPIIQQEAKMWCLKNGEQFTPGVMDEMRAQMTYANIPAEYKIKEFIIERNDIFILQMRERVEMCRKYIATFEWFTKAMEVPAAQ